MCVGCPAGHTVCNDCFEALVKYVIIARQGSQVRCPESTCQLEFTKVAIFDNTSSHTRAAFHQLEVDLARRALAQMHSEAFRRVEAAEAASRSSRSSRSSGSSGSAACWQAAHLGHTSPPLEEQGPVLVEVDRANAVFRD